ncbi:MAG: hypothetical protein IJB67_05300 [Firmicutes bacterium]|nr:hypothetical protein [Bacillota bacterium]
MTLSELKFAESDFEGQDIASLDDRPKISAAELKKRFDNIGKAMLALGRFNQLIDSLISGEALNEMSVPGMDGATLAEVLSALDEAVQEMGETQQGIGGTQQEMGEAQQGLSEAVRQLGEAQQALSEAQRELSEKVQQEMANVVKAVNGVAPDESGNVALVSADEVSY